MTNLNPDEKKEILRELYYDPQKGLYNHQKLYQKVKELQKVGQVYHGPLKQIFYPITAPPASYQADLMFYPKTKKVNNGYNTILTLIEITSRMRYCFPMKGKTMAQVLGAMKTFLGTKGVEIQNLTTYKGSEFKSGG